MSKNNIHGINGHRSVGGFRVSLYNAISINSDKILVEMMQNLIKKDDMKILANDGIAKNAVEILNENGFEVY